MEAGAPRPSRPGPRLMAAAACLLIAACSVAPSPVATGTRAPAATVPAQPGTIPPTSASPAAAAIQVQLLDPRFVPADVPVSGAGQILWSARDDVGPSIWALRPPAQVPALLFRSEHADGVIAVVTASGAGYAFIELSEDAFGEGGWRLWFLPRPGEPPIEVDGGNAPHAGVAPTIALDERRLAWASFDEPSSGPRSSLEVAELDRLADVTTLLDAPIEERRLWYPLLSGDTLWYATIKADLEGLVDPEYHIERLDLTQPRAAPMRFPGLGLDFNPALNDSFFVFKTNAQGDSPLNWGTLHLMDLVSGALTEIPVEHANRPSIGDRYLGFDEITRSRLLLFDTTRGQLIDVGAMRADRAPGAVLYAGESVSGTLLAFIEQGTDSGAQPRIGWAMLPE